MQFRYRSMARDEIGVRTMNPYALFSDNGVWYVVGLDLERDDIRTFRVSRIQGDITFATSRERDFRAPTDFDPSEFRGRPPWQIGEPAGEARIEVAPDTAWWVERSFGASERAHVEDGVFVTEYAAPAPARIVGAAPERPRAARSTRRSSWRRSRRAARERSDAHERPPP